MILDSAANPGAPQALVGRRALRWIAEQEGFGAAAMVREVRMSFAGEPEAVVLGYEDPLVDDELVPLTEVMIPAVTDLMVDDGARALVASYRRQADPEKAAQQQVTAEKHARLVLEAAIEGRRP